MAGPIQTSLNKLIGLASGGLVAGKKLIENERQIGIAKEQETIEKAKKTAKEKREKESLNSAYRTAQKKGLDRAQILIFNGSGEAVATYNEMGALLSRQALANSLEARKNTQKRILERKLFLKNKGGKK